MPFDRTTAVIAPDPLESLRPLGDGLVALGGALVLGLALGAALARLLRERHLHWSWGLLAAAAALAARPLLAGVCLPASIAALAATRSARRWHREDLESGADLRAAALAEVTPLDQARRGAARLASRLGDPALANGAASCSPPLGRDARGRGVRVDLAGGRHALVVGATGSGKTVTETAIASHEIAAGAAAVIVDPKGDASMLEAIRRAAGREGRRFVHWSPEGGAVYNPYAVGSDTEIADKILGGELFSEPHYLRQAQRYLGHVVRALRATGQQVSLAEIVEHLDPDRLEVLARRLPEDAAPATHAYLDALVARQRAELSGVRDRLAVLAESDAGVWLDPRTAAPRFELLQAVRAGACVYFSLEADRRPLLAQMLGAAIVQDLLTTVAALQRRPSPALVVFDEFSALAARGVVRLFGRARSAGVSLLLGTQELADLRVAGGEQLLEQVVGNLSLIVAHRQVVPASAELIASIAGMRGAWRTTHGSDGRSSRTRVRERVLDPGRIMTLAAGEAAVIGLGDGAGARIARIRRVEEAGEAR